MTEPYFQDHYAICAQVERKFKKPWEDVRNEDFILAMRRRCPTCKELKPPSDYIPQTSIVCWKCYLAKQREFLLRHCWRCKEDKRGKDFQPRRLICNTCIRDTHRGVDKPPL